MSLSLLLSLLLLPVSLVAQTAGARTPDKISVEASQLYAVIGPDLLRANRVEISLANGSVLKGRVRNVSRESIELEVAGGQAPKPLTRINTGEVSVIRMQNRKASKARRILGGILGGAAGFFIGAPLAFVLVDTGSEALSLTVFFSMPALGAWAGVSLAGRSRGWTTVLVNQSATPSRFRSPQRRKFLVVSEPERLKGMHPSRQRRRSICSSSSADLPPPVHPCKLS